MPEHPALEDACCAQSRTQGLMPEVAVAVGDEADVELDACPFARIAWKTAMARKSETRNIVCEVRAKR